MMRNFIYLCIFAGTLIGLTACDDGRLYEEESPIAVEGRTVNLLAHLSGVASWPGPEYYVELAGFGDDSEYALISKAIPAPSTEGGEVSIQLAGIKDNVKRVELCVLNRLRKRVLSFYTIEEADLKASSTINVDAGTLNVGMYHTMQERVFNTTCVNCHGAATSAAAGLYLTEGRSYEALVGVPSVKKEGLHIVEPGKADESVLYQALATDVSIAENWRYNHTAEVVNEDILALIRTWINSGAKE